MSGGKIMQLLSCIAIVAIIGAALPTHVMGQEVVHPPFQLSGKGVKHHPPIADFADREYVLMHGERTDHGCKYPPPVTSGKYPDERMVETDDANCLQIRALGYFTGFPPPSRPNVHSSLSSFDFRTDKSDTSSARRDSARRDSVRHKP